MRNRHHIYLVIIVSILWGLLLNSPVAFCYDQNAFPLSEKLEPKVNFWKNIYTLYSTDQIVIHDAVDLDIVYEILDTKDLFPFREISEKEKWEAADAVKKKYQQILINLSDKDPVKLEQLSIQERYVYNLFKDNQNPDTFRIAAHNIRAQRGLRDSFRKGLIRSGRYLPQIKRIFKKNHLPMELIALPHVESSFDYNAYSKLGAAGIWQFTRSTGRRFLQINYTLDERFDPIKSTEAAAKLLKENYETLGTWPLAITAYNHGVYGMKRAVNTLNTKDIDVIIEKYKSRSFKFASRNFYAEFLAALLVTENYQIYFGEITFDEPVKYQLFKVPSYVRLSTITDRLKVTTDEIKELNPSLRRSVLQSRRRLPEGFELKLYYRENFDPQSVYAAIPSNEKHRSQLSTMWYQVERGDNLHNIARRFDKSIFELMELNDIQNPDQIYVGQVLRVQPEEIMVAEKSPKTIDGSADNIPADRVENIKIVPQTSDEQIYGPHLKANFSQQNTYVGPAKKDKTTRTDRQSQHVQYAHLAITNNVDSDDNISYGTIVVQPEETLGHFADWLKIRTQELRNLNGLQFHQDIVVGQEIQLLFKNVTQQNFNQRRLEFHRAIEEDFFNSFRIDGINIHRIKSGENIWYLCNDIYNVPYWLLIKYNPDRDLQNLNTGDKLIIPNIVEKNKIQD